MAPGDIRVFIHHTTSGANPAAAENLAEQLRRAGFIIAAIRPVLFRINNGGVRYFFPQDRGEARRLLEVTNRLRGETTRGPTDFTHYTPKPSPGTVELWLSTAP